MHPNEEAATGLSGPSTGATAGKPPISFPAGVFLFDLTEWSAVELHMTEIEPASVGLLDESISRP